MCVYIYMYIHFLDLIFFFALITILCSLQLHKFQEDFINRIYGRTTVIGS